MSTEMLFEQATPGSARYLTDRIKAGFAEYSRLTALRDLHLGKPAKPTDDRPVYFIEAGNGLVKIGVSDSPQSRLQTLQTMSPVPLRLRLVLPNGGAALETKLHRRFHKHWSHGEWFRLAPEIREFIRSRS